MKSSNQNNKQNKKLDKQVSHLSGFIGMPMWNGRNPTLSEIREHDRLLLEKQALGFEPKQKGLLSLLLKGLRDNIAKPSAKVENPCNNTITVRLESKKPTLTGNECCG